MEARDETKLPENAPCHAHIRTPMPPREDARFVCVDLRAREASLSAVSEERDALRSAATEARAIATAASVEAIALEEKMLAMRSEELKLRREAEDRRADAERRDRAFRAAAADRDQMRGALTAMRREREALQLRLRKMAVELSLIHI